MRIYGFLGACLFGLVLSNFGTAVADDTAPKKLEMAGGKLSMVLPADWKSVQPASRIVDSEFQVPADADPSARVTVMGAGGSIDANIERWFGQFTQPDGKATKDVAKVEKKEIAGQTVHTVDITGNFKESMGGGPFAPGKIVNRENYEMLAAIVVTKEMGQYFIKMTGPADLVSKQKEAFNKMLDSLQVEQK